MAKRLSIEFRYVDRRTCSRCRTTDKGVARVVQELRKKGIVVDFKTRKLPVSKLAQSNSVLINGKDVEGIINRKKNVRSSACRGCSKIIESPCNCRTYIYRGKNYTYVPGAMIREALLAITF